MTTTAALGPQDGYPPMRIACYLVGVLIIANILSFVDRQILALLVGPIRRDLAITDTDISVLHGFAFTILYSFLGLPLGRFVDRHNRRLVIVAGVAIWSVMTIACGLANSFWELFAARVGVGIGEATLAPAAYSLISDAFRPDRRGTALSVYTSGIYLGIGAALTLGGLVIAMTNQLPEVTLPLFGTVRSWQAAFIIVGLPGLLLAPLILTITEPPRRRPLSAAANVTPDDALRYLKGNGRAFLFTLLAYDCFAMAAYAAGSWVPTVFVRVHHWPMAQTGLYYGLAIMVMGCAGGALAGIFGDRMISSNLDGRLRLSLYSIPLWIAAIATGTLSGDPWVALAGFGFSAFFSSVSNCIGPTVVQEMTPGRLRGQATALYFFTQNLFSLTLGPMAVALVTDKIFHDDTAVAASILVVALPAILLGGLFTLLARRPFTQTRQTLEFAA
ncbi:MFS transporter [Azospirillum sp.]|uniref:spinster family MFS transporter n=1 Tax=Azospirillum sp. TaxID=34012 RepID=UPI00260ED213|nr:MFS transporter [Azospirillum sp.]